MVMNQTLKHQLDAITDAARINLHMSGHLVPVAFLIGPQGVDIITCPFNNDEEKEAFIIGLRRRAKEEQATMSVILSEAWVRKLPNAKSLDDWDGVPASLSPDKTEAVVLCIETLDSYWLGQAPIIRTNGKPTFAAVQYYPQGERDPRERFQQIL